VLVTKTVSSGRDLLSAASAYLQSEELGADVHKKLTFERIKA
jgi:hypothetical protein